MPVHLARQALLRGRPSARSPRSAARPRGVGVGVPHVALLRRARRGRSGRRPDTRPIIVEHLVDGDARAATDIVARAPGRRGGRGRRWRSTASATKVKSRVCSPSPYTRDRLAVERGAQEAVEAHVRPLPRAVDREVAQRHGRHAEVREVQVAELLGGQLASRRTARPAAAAASSRIGIGDVVAVDRRARRIDEPLERPPDARLEQHLRRLDVVLGVDREIACPSSCARRPAPPGGRRASRRRAAPRRSASWIAPRRTGSRGCPRSRREVALLDRPRVVVGEAVDADDLGAVREQPLAEVRADEPGARR